MKAIGNLTEGIKPVKNGLMLCDIDDTLLSANNIYIIKTKNGVKSKLTPEEYAKDPESRKPYPPGVSYSYEEFNNPEKVRNSILSGTPLLKNLKILDAYVNAGYDVAFLTARGLEDVVKSSLEEFLKFRDKNGVLKPLGEIFKKSLSVAVNDEKYSKIYGGASDSQRKAAVIADLAKKYEKVYFFDDDLKNIDAVKKMKLPNVKTIKAIS
jgi:hypothetical protein